MTLGQFLRGVTLQGNICLSVWEDGEEVESLTFSGEESSYYVLQVAKECKLVSAKIDYVFANADFLRIEITREV